MKRKLDQYLVEGKGGSVPLGDNAIGGFF